MEDLDIAKGLIGTIIDEDIVEIHFATQETAVRPPNRSISVMRMDFVAKIRAKTGGTRKVLIELQKARISGDAQRFRTYLGKQYQTQDDVRQTNGLVRKESLPIIAIYILGFNLEKHIPAILKVNRRYLNLITDEPVSAPSKFVESLSHDTYVIQAKQLHHDVKSKLERILSVFGQEEFIDDKGYKIDFPDSAESTEKNELLQKILRRLHKAATENSNLVEQMDAQDQLDREIESGYATLKQQKEDAQREKKEAQQREEDAKREKEEAQRREEELRNVALNALIAAGLSEEDAQKQLKL